MKEPYRLILLLAALIAAPALAADRPLVLVDLQESGRTEVFVPLLAGSLGPAGVDVGAMIDAARLGAPNVIVLSTGNTYEPDDLGALRGFIQGGGGVLCLIGPTSRHAEAAAAMFGELGLKVLYTRNPRNPLRIAEDPITRDVKTLPLIAYRTSLLGAGRKPLVSQGEVVVAASVQSGKGRLVLIPATMVLGENEEAPQGDQVRLLAQACAWLSGVTAPAAPQVPATTPAGNLPAGPQTAPGENALRPGAVPDTRPRPMRSVLNRPRSLPTEDFAGTILVDITAADDNWDLAAGTLDQMLGKYGRPVRYLQGQGVQSPLVAALAKPPALLIVGSARVFSVDEAVAISHYVQMGGRVLFLAHAIGDYVIRLVDLNTLLREFEISVSLVRPDGPTLLADHPISRGMRPPPPMMRGVNIWSRRTEAIAKAGVRPYLSVIELDEGGRIAVADAKSLLVGTKAYKSLVQTSAPLPFVPLMQATVDWLLEARAQ